MPTGDDGDGRADGQRPARPDSDGEGDGGGGGRDPTGNDGEVTGESRVVAGHRVRGLDVDEATRCAHYATERDVVAIRFACCETFHPCHACHDAVADHPSDVWPQDSFDEPAVLCGACGTVLSIETYRDCDDVCPACDHEFNPGCAAHADRYFAV